MIRALGARFTGQTGMNLRSEPPGNIPTVSPSGNPHTQSRLTSAAIKLSANPTGCICVGNYKQYHFSD